GKGGDHNRQVVLTYARLGHLDPPEKALAREELAGLYPRFPSPGHGKFPVLPVERSRPANTYQIRHALSATILLPFLQLKLLANSGKSLRTVFARYSSGACGSVCACVRSCSGRVSVHHCC